MLGLLDGFILKKMIWTYNLSIPDRIINSVGQSVVDDQSVIHSFGVHQHEFLGCVITNNMS